MPVTDYQSHRLYRPDKEVNSLNDSSNIPAGFCKCGCGQRTPISKYTDKRHEAIKGHPLRYVRGHALFQDLTDQRFGRLAVLHCVGRDKFGNAQWHVVCDCGNDKVVAARSLREQSIVSCGCLRREKFHVNTKTHGRTNTPEFRTWTSMKNRCLNPASDDYPRYGGRGIKMYAIWQHSFETFLEHVGRRPSPEHSIDRIDNERGYLPDNVRWATRKEQQRNTSRNLPLSYKGQVRTLIEWSEITEIKYTTLHQRLQRGWSVAKTLETPV